MPVDIAERKRRAIRGELSEVALGLLTDRKFESLTAADIVARPAGEDPVMAVQTSFRQLTAAYDDRALALVRLVRETPSLQQQERINREHLRISVVNALATRLGMDVEHDMRPQILATIAFAPLDAAMFSWFGNRSNEEVGHLL